MYKPGGEILFSSASVVMTALVGVAQVGQAVQQLSHAGVAERKREGEREREREGGRKGGRETGRGEDRYMQVSYSITKQPFNKGIENTILV